MEETLESVKSLLFREKEASLGTLEGDIPFVSVTNYLFEPGEGEALGEFYLLLSGLARHTKNVQKNSTVSLLVVERKPEVSVLERKRVTVVGRAEFLEEAQRKELIEQKYRDRFPLAQIFLTLPDFRFYRIVPREVHWIGGFAKARSWKLSE